MTPEQLLETILKSIINYPDDIQIDRSVDELGVLLEVKLNKEDVGLAIGVGGKTMNSIRHIVKMVGRRNKETIGIKVID